MLVLVLEIKTHKLLTEVVVVGVLVVLLLVVMVVQVL